MNDLIGKILQSLDCELGEITLGRLEKYIHLMASTCKTDDQLIALGKAYVSEILHPDPRYSGC